MPRGGEAVPATAASGRVRAVGARERLAKLVLSVPALWLVPAATLHPSRRGQRWQAALAAARYVLRTCVLRRPSRVRVGDSSVIIGRAGEFNPLHAVVRNPPNPEMLVWRARLSPGDLFVDVGANIGLYTVYACERGAEVVAVEPDPTNVARIRENLAANGARAEVVAQAVDRVEGTVVMTEDLNERNHLLPEGSAGRTVRATTLDALLAGRTAMVKIDVEGAEQAVLEGAEQSLRERRITLMQLEWGLDEESTIHDRSPLLELLQRHGYALYESDRSGALHALGDRMPTTLNVFAMPA